ncbi:hypothetical protein FOCC_FOCC015573 [Frankliniella occidentalis]|nr:hypothetical protein FOCC_FOCC015573 [Frankliniella occidentalis]
MGRWFQTSPSACPETKNSHGADFTRERDTGSDYCTGRSVQSSAASSAAGPTLDHLVDIAIRNEPRERERDELERHVDTFSDELELVEPTTVLGRLRQSVRNGGVLHPQSYWHLAWLLLVTAGFAYNCVTIPLRSTFPYQTPDNWSTWFIFDLACDVVYFLDLVLVKPHVIFMQTFWELFDHLDSMLMSPYLVRVARTLCYMMFLVHLNACGYYAFSAREGLGTNNWTYKGGDGHNAYIRCFYFATKTATSVGKNPRPETEGEYLFMTCSWLMGVFVFALLIGQIRDIVATASRTRNEHRKRLDETLEHMRALSLPDHVQRRVQSWFTFADQHQPFDEGRILNSLPQKLKTDVALDVHGTTLAKVHLFQKIADQALIRDLVLKLRSVIYLPGDFICRKNEVGKEMYIVKTGQVEVLAPTNGEVLATLGEGSVFGEISLLALAGGNRRTADVRSKGFSNLFVLSKSDLHDTLVYYPDAQKVLKQKAEVLMQENADRERRENRLQRGSSPSSQEEDEPSEESGSEVSPPSTSVDEDQEPEPAGAALEVAVDPAPQPPESPGPPPGPASTPSSSPGTPDHTQSGLQAGLLTPGDSDLTSVTCTTVSSRSSASRFSPRSSCTCTCSCTCSCSCSSYSCNLADPRSSVDTGVAVASSLWGDDREDGDDDDDAGEGEGDGDSDTLSGLSSTSLFSPLVSPVLGPQPPHLAAAAPVTLQHRRRVSAPSPSTTTLAFDVAGGNTCATWCTRLMWIKGCIKTLTVVPSRKVWRLL